MCDQQSLRSACAYAQSDQSLRWSLDYTMIVKLRTEHHLEFLSLKGGSRGSPESTLVKMSNCWKSHAWALIFSISHRLLLHSMRRNFSFQSQQNLQITKRAVKIFLNYEYSDIASSINELKYCSC